MSPNPLARDTLTDGVIREIQGMILSGEVPPAGWLPPQPELAQRFGVGLSTVREAIKALTLVGLVRPLPGRGTQVSPDALAILNASSLVRSRLEELDAIKLCEARQIIEVGLTVLAAERASDEDIRTIQDALHRMRASLQDDKAFAQADLDFHLAISRAARNDLLSQFYFVSQRLLSETTEYFAGVPGVKVFSLALQQEILDAIHAHDVDAARVCAERHMEYLGELIQAPFVQKGKQPAQACFLPEEKIDTKTA